MQPARRSNAARRATTRQALIGAARGLFSEKGYAETGTPDIVATAGVTRGALYHHFEDKKALFAAVAEAEAEAVAAAIEQAAPPGMPALAALRAGAEAYLHAMGVPGRTRLLLIDGPAVLGREGMDRLEARHGNRTLREGLEAAMATGVLTPLPLDALTTLLAAMFDRAALAIAQGNPLNEQLEVVTAVLGGLRK